MGTARDYDDYIDELERSAERGDASAAELLKRIEEWNEKRDSEFLRTISEKSK